MAYVRPQFWTTLPFKDPLICNLAGSGMIEVDAMTGPDHIVSGCIHIKRVKKIHTQWTSSVKSLRETPLTLVSLRCSARNVVCSRISKHIVKRILLGDILCGLSDDDS